MKCLSFFSVVAALALSSCYYSHEEALPFGEKSITFNLAAEGLTHEALTRADIKTPPVLKTPTEILVLDSFEGTTTYKQFSSLSNVVMPLKYGTHDLYFVASCVKGTSFSTERLLVQWPNDGTMTSVWAYHYQIEVGDDTSFEDIVLPLVVADVRVATLDKVPVTTAKAVIDAPDLSTVLDLTTMKAAASSNGFKRTLSFPALTNPVSFSVDLYTFVPASLNVGDLSVAFYSDADCTQEIASREISDISVNAGYMSLYSGYFFSGGISIPMDYQEGWLGMTEYSY